MMLFLQAMLMLCLYDIASYSCSFRTLYSKPKEWNVRRMTVKPDTIETICAAINYACSWYPKQVLCLQRSFVTIYLLRKYGVAAQIVLGAQQLPFKAHAWVEVNGTPINELSDVQGTYAVWDRN